MTTLTAKDRPSLAWPERAVFIDLSAAAHYSDGTSRCTAVALCDERGRPSRTFAQGDTAVFYYEFEILKAIGIASVGVEFRNAAGMVMHGRNGFQMGNAVQARQGTRLRCRQTVKLDVGVGEYIFGVGLASCDERSYRRYQEHALPHERFSTKNTERSRVRDVGRFTVTLPADGYLAYHGAVGLAGSSAVELLEIDKAPSVVGPGRVLDESPDQAPTVFHITHWKAGSQWILKILEQTVPERIVPPQVGEAQFVHWPIGRGRVYPTLYITSQQFNAVQLPADWTRFVVVRDLRDTLVSAYFSFRSVHPELEPGMSGLRAVLQEADLETGMVYLMDNWLGRCAAIQLSWLEAGEPLIRYGDLLTADTQILESVLIDRCRLPVSRERLREAVEANRFERITAGRRRGDEDLGAHERKGVAGDWKNHFTDRLKQAFKARFGGVLVATGYERDLDW